MTNAATKKLADQMIGAAQALEHAARLLKAEAKVIRQYGLPVATEASVDLMRMHKRNDIQHWAETAHKELVS